MNPLEYLEFCKDDIYLRLIDGAFYSPEKAKEIIQTLGSFVNRLSEVRHSEEKTNIILNEIDKFPDNEMRSIKHWLVKSLVDDDSFVYAFNPLAQYSNRQTIIICYQVKNISKPELYEMLKAKESLNKISTPITKAVDYSGLLFALKNYIEGISDIEFTNIIVKHSLTPGTPKAKWEGSPADAHRFATITKIKLPEFDKCFSLPNGRKLKHNDKNITTSPIIDILQKHFNK